MRLREFHRAFHSAEATWDQTAAVAEMPFAEGLVFSCLLVTPFWIAVAILVVHLIK